MRLFKKGKKLPFQQSFSPTYMCVKSCFVKCTLEFGTWSKKTERYSNPTSKWELEYYSSNS